MASVLPFVPGAGQSAICKGIRQGLLVGAACLAIAVPAAVHSDTLGNSPVAARVHRTPEVMARSSARFADFGTARPSPDARHVADWVADSNDNADTDFVIIDKKQARLYVFDASARLRASTPVLLGAARGDDSVPDIGTRPLADVRPEERTTPAGRFLAERGHDTSGDDVVWVDYDASVSMHRVITTSPKERRLERLATPTAADNRISWGCINVPAAFYETMIRPIFAARRAVVYVLPDIKPVQAVFNSYDVAAAHGLPLNIQGRAARVAQSAR